MTCREFADFIADYLAGQLPAERAAEFTRHLQVCANCDRYLAQYRDTVALGRRAFAADEDEIPGDVPEDLVKAILASRRTDA